MQKLRHTAPTDQSARLLYALLSGRSPSRRHRAVGPAASRVSEVLSRVVSIPHGALFRSITERFHLTTFDSPVGLAHARVTSHERRRWHGDRDATSQTRP